MDEPDELEGPVADIVVVVVGPAFDHEAFNATLAIWSDEVFAEIDTRPVIGVCHEVRDCVPVVLVIPQSTMEPFRFTDTSPVMLGLSLAVA